MATKIDLEKAYDRLRWSFIYATLSDMSFLLLLIDVIIECVQSPRMRILWNGEPTTQFIPSRGLRQGDPLSSYLFVMCLEKLKQAINLEVRNHNWKPIILCRDGTMLTNLFFADDMVIFGEASVEQALVINFVINNFCKAYGEKVSVPKSRVFFSNNTDISTRTEVCEALGFEETDDLGKYLGMPTINGRVTRQTFAHLEDKINKRLAGWSTKRLSLAGRATLVQSTLTTIANYRWKWELFSDLLPQTILQKIASISLIEDPDMEDSLYGIGTSTGKFSIKLALGFLQSENTTDEIEPIIWRTIWLLPIQQRVRMFLWLAGHERIMVNVNRVKQNMGDNPLCPRCEEDEETTDHLLRHCEISRQVWSLLGIDSSNPTFYNSSFPEWITKCASNGVATSEPNWPIFFAITCWWLWKWRNNIVFGREAENPTNPKVFLHQQFDATKKAFDRFDIFIPNSQPVSKEVYIR
ncbi:uncharacterized protein LOC141617835 [Silene latifolia]|uniref:uncharacterized protein LOC141617835 n=1 Tax=Silene latifolia TaxID=37657 RepID=UPI003D77BE15